MNLILNQINNIIHEDEKIKQTYVNLSSKINTTPSFLNKILYFLENRLSHIYTLHFHFQSHHIAIFVQNIHEKIIQSNFIDNKFTKTLCDHLDCITQNCKKFFEEMKDHSLENIVNFIHYYTYVLRLAYFTSFNLSYLKELDFLHDKLTFMLILDCFD